MNEDTTTTPDPIALGTWIGWEQAFNARVAWPQAGPRHRRLQKPQPLLGGVLPYARRHQPKACRPSLIAHLAEFGVPYFQLTDIVPVSPAVYREIKPAITDGALEFHGEQNPHHPRERSENHSRGQRSPQRKSSTPGPTRSLAPRPTFCEGFRRLVGQSDHLEKPGLRPLIIYSVAKLNDLAQRL